jgi:dihydrofolate reductase
MSKPPGVISVRLAMSLDGYIADHDGGYAWIVPVPSRTLDTEHQLPFDDFLTDVDIVVMGRHCYEQGQAHDYVTLGKPVIVATSTPPASGPEGIQFCDDVVNVVTAARDRGYHCFLFGGGVLVHSFLAAHAVDMLTVGIVPVLLGGGRSLFPGEHSTIDLRLTDYTVGDGKVRLVYQRR